MRVGSRATSMVANRSTMPASGQPSLVRRVTDWRTLLMARPAKL